MRFRSSCGATCQSDGLSKLELYLKRTLQGFGPADELAAAAITKHFKLGDLAKLTVTKPKDPRSVQQNRLYWKLCQVVFENTEGAFDSAEQVSDFLKIQAGHCEKRHINLNGEKLVWLIPKSISFAKMPQPEFQEYMQAALDIVCQRIIVGMDKDALEAEIKEMIS